MEVEEQGEEKMEVEEEMDREEEMDIDPPAAVQARAPHSLSAVRVGCLLPGWGWSCGWGWGCNCCGWALLQGHGARSPPPGGTTATATLP